MRDLLDRSVGVVGFSGSSSPCARGGAAGPDLRADRQRRLKPSRALCLRG